MRLGEASTLARHLVPGFTPCGGQYAAAVADQQRRDLVRRHTTDTLQQRQKPPVVSIVTQEPKAMAVVETERHGQVLVVRMNRPERLNALDHEVRSQLAATWTEFRHNNELEAHRS